MSFCPDGRSLLYASERGGSWNLYRTDLTDDAEPDFFNATASRGDARPRDPAERFQPHFSPDGKEVAYLEERTTLKVLDLATGRAAGLCPGDRNYSYADGDQWYQWSPGRTLAGGGVPEPRAAGRTRSAWCPRPATERSSTSPSSGYEDSSPRWMGKGERR